MKTLIYNSGESGFGGVFKSCYLIAIILKKNGYSPNIVSITDSIYWDRLEDEGISSEVIDHIFYSKKRNRGLFENIFRKIFNRYKKKKFFPDLSLIFNDVIHFRFIKSLSSLIKERDIKLIHTNVDFFKDITVFKAAADLKLPVICHLRTMPKRKLAYFERRLAGYRRGLFIAISRAVFKEWNDAGIPVSRMKMIYNSQGQLKNGKPEDRKGSDNIGRDIRLLFVGRLKRHKGVDILINALSLIDHKGWTLSIVGEGSEKEDLEKLAEEKGLSHMVIFYGFREDVDSFYRSHDIIIVPSLNEPFGRVVIEAMRHGIAVIASNNGGIPEIIADGKDGILFETGDIRGLSEAIASLMHDRGRRTGLGLRGREKIGTMFSEEVFNKELIGTYDQLLKDNK